MILLNEIALIGNDRCTYWWDDKNIDPHLNQEDNLRCMCALADISYDEKRIRSLMQELDLNIGLSRKIDTVSGG